jgi:hypothetical protein
MSSKREHHRRAVVVPVAACLVVCLAVAASAYWSSASSAGSRGAAVASSINQGAQPRAIVSTSSVAVDWAATTRSDGGPVDGYIVKRYDAGTLAPQTPILAGCSGTITGTACTENGVPNGNWKYTVTPVFATNWRGAESTMSATATVSADVTAPTNNLTLNNVTGTSYLSGNTVYYRGSAPGSFTLTNAVADAGSGPASSATAALTGTTTGWSHTPATVSTPAGGPYVSGAFSWAASATGPATEVVTGRDMANNSAATTLTFTNDSTAPNPGSVGYTSGFTTSRSVAVTFAAGPDAGSGVATGQLQRSSASFVGGVCGSFSTFADIGPVNPASPYNDSSVNNSTCYQYRYVVTDNVGNAHTATSASVAKVDYAASIGSTPGLLSHWRLGESTTSSDSMTGADGTLLTAHTGEVGATWTHAAGNGNSVLTGNRSRRNGGVYTWDYASAVPASPDYSVEAQFTRVAHLSDDNVGVIARLNTVTNSFYAGEYYELADGRIDYSISKYTNGVWAGYLGSPSTFNVLATGTAARLRLQVSGGATTTLKLYVNGVLTVSTTDSSSPITAAGRAGIMDGDPGLAVTKTATTGAHADNFAITPRAADSVGTSHGAYDGAMLLGEPGALSADTNTSVEIDGLNDDVRTPARTLTDLSVEFWFKSTQGIGTGTQWYDGAALVDSSATGSVDDWGTSLRDDGRVVAGVGNPDTSIVSATGGFNDGAWHHVVFTRNNTTGAMVLYVDGSSAAGNTGTGPSGARAAGSDIAFGRQAGNMTQLFAGHLDEVSLYGAVLDATTVGDHYALGASAPGDYTGPTGGSVDASGLAGTGSRYATSTTLSLNLAKGSDPSGVAPTGATLSRAAATLTSGGGTTNGVCGSYGSYALITGGTDPVSPKSDTVADQACYRYRYVVQDLVGNSRTYTSPDIKVDTTAPSVPTYAFSAMTGAHWNAVGSTVYYRPAASSGGFTATATATDAASGIQGFAFPSLGTGWTTTPGALGVMTYSWTGTPAVPGTVSGSATNNAAITSATGPMTVTADSTPPTGGTISYPNGSQSGTTASVSFTTGTDAGSGLGTRLLQRAQATLTGGTCGTFGAFATVTGGTNPSSPQVDSFSAGSCYKWQYVVADNVGNTYTAASNNVVKVASALYPDTVDSTSDLIGYWRLGEDTISSDFFTDPNDTLLTTHTGAVGATWTQLDGSANEIITANKARRNGTGYSRSYVSGVPPTADYAVEADFTKVGQLANDHAGLMVRLNTASSSFYVGRYTNNADGTVNYRISQYTNGNIVENIGTNSDNNVLPVGGTVRMRMTVKGTATLALYVNGQLEVSGTDTTSPITAAGRAGIMDGDPSVTTANKTATAGVHIDNMSITPAAVDEVAGNDAGYRGNPTLNQGGAIGGDTDTAALFDGIDDHVVTPDFALSTFSTEFWFKSTQGIGTASNWNAGAALVDSSRTSGSTDWGTSLRSDGRVVAGIGGAGGCCSPPDKSIVSATGGYNDGLWHQVVFTRNNSTGAMVLYVDGSSANGGTATGPTGARHNYAIVFGRQAEDLSHAYQGGLDEVSLYDAVITQTTVTNHYQAGTAVPGDYAGPTGGSVDASGLVGTGARYSTSTTLSLVLAKGTDPSGVSPTGATLSRSSATLTSAGGTADGVCGTYGSYALITGGTDPVSPTSDTVADQACYRYRYVVQDLLGNSRTYTSADIKVDSTAPSAPTYAFSNFTSAYWSGTGSTVFYRPGAGSGAFMATTTSTDAASGIVSAALPTLGSGWTSTPGALGVNTYSWSGTPAVPGTVTGTTTNNATVASATGPFTVSADSTAPTAGTISYTNGTQPATTVSVDFTTGTDAGSGVGTRLLKRASATLTGTTCGSYSAFATVTGGTDPTSPHVDTVTTGNCYKYQYVVADNVGNTHTATSTGVVRIDNTCGTRNVALGRPATASTTNLGYTADKAFDGDTGSRWESAFADPQWISVDLGSSQWFCKIVLNWEAAAAQTFKIQTSDDGNTWIDVASIAGAGGLQTWNITGTGRYVRMYGMTRTTAYGYSLWEFEVYAGATDDVLMSQGQPTTASSQENAGTGAANATDGDTTTTRWASVWNVDPQWLQVDLGQTSNISQVTLFWEAAYATSFKLQTSNDASTWTDMYSTASGAGGVQTLDVSGAGRYVRVLGTARANPTYGYSLYDFKVWGTPGP